MDFKPTVRIWCELDEDYSLSIRNGKVVLAFANPLDPFQHWIKEETTDGGFTLFNKGTAQAIVPSSNVGPINYSTIELLLVSMPFGSHPDPQAVWTTPNEKEDHFTTVFAKQGDRQNFLLQPHSQLAYDGNTVILTNYSSGGSHNNWMFVPYHQEGVVCPKTIKIYSRANPSYNLTIRDDSVVFALCDRTDPYQHWRKEIVYCQHLKDQDGFRAFSMVNAATGEAIQHNTSNDYGYAVTLAPFNPASLHESLLWTESTDDGEGFKKIKLRKHGIIGLDAMFDQEWLDVGLQEGMRLGIWEDAGYDTHQWKMEEFF